MPLDLLRNRPRSVRAIRYLIAMLCALAAGLSVLHFGSRTDRRATPPAAAAVLVARSDLPAGHLLRPKDLRVAQYPLALRPSGASATTTGVLGRRLSGPMQRGEPFTAARFVGRDLLTGLPPGTVAIAVTLADAHNGQVLRPGDRVDVLPSPADSATASQLQPAAHRDSPGTRVTARNALVLAVLTGAGAGDDAGATGDVAPDADDDGTTADPTGSQPAVLLAVDRATALRLAASDQEGGFIVLGLAP